MTSGDRLRVYYDDQCELCRSSRRWVEAREAGGTVEFVALVPADAGSGTPRRPATANLVVELEGAPPLVGYEGWLAVLGRLPGWRRLAPALSLPPLLWIGAVLYRLVARHRHRLWRRAAN